MATISGNHLHIISFDVPYPANYGGVIDVFHKIRLLHHYGIGITLHCFEYGRGIQAELENYCSQVFYYPRKTGLAASLSSEPYVVASRRNPDLLRNLLCDSDPILFEGLHTCGLLGHPQLARRKKIYRESNIEHHYYLHLAKAEKNVGKKLFFATEALKLKLFEKTLNQADLLLAVSYDDTRYLQGRFPARKTVHLPSFHANDRVTSLPGQGSFVLYQGKLSVPENYRAAEFLIERVIAGTGIPMVVAGMDPPGSLGRLAARHPEITLIANPDQATMDQLTHDAQVNLMLTFQPTGLKLKLLNALFNGRHCLVNNLMLAGTNLHELCSIGNDARTIKELLTRLMPQPMLQSAIDHRSKALATYSNETHAAKIIRLIFHQEVIPEADRLSTI